MKPEALLYKAQTIGNIEPIEYMIPYPSTQALIEGKTLKFGNQIIYEDYKITNIDFYKLVQKTANWLNDKGIQPKENVLIEKKSPKETNNKFIKYSHQTTIFH